jgi:hypothetical protein
MLARGVTQRPEFRRIVDGVLVRERDKQDSGSSRRLLRLAAIKAAGPSFTVINPDDPWFEYRSDEGGESRLKQRWETSIRGAKLAVRLRRFPWLAYRNKPPRPQPELSTR